MKKPIYERIKSEAEAEAKAILSEAEVRAAELIKSGVAKLTLENSEQLSEAALESAARVKNFAAREERSLITFQEQTRQQLVVDVFSEVSGRLSRLEEKDLLNFVIHLIKSENVLGEEVLHVSRRNKAKYLKALGKKLELLNAANPHYKFTFSEEATYIEEGFLLSGPQFDLVFDFAEVVAEYQKENEQRIYNELFSNE